MGNYRFKITNGMQKMNNARHYFIYFLIKKQRKKLKLTL